MDDLILRAARIAQLAHARQMRKYTARPYIEHPARVAAKAMLLDAVTPPIVAAAWLHDVIEDCEYTREKLLAEGIPAATVSLVEELTNPSKQHPELSRAKRKALDREHLAHISLPAKRLKLIDRVDNLRDMRNAPADFLSLYAAESLQLADALTDIGSEQLEELYLAVEFLGFQRDYHDPRVSET